MGRPRKFFSHRNPHSEQGAVLLIVLWVVIVLSVLAFGFASNIQIGSRSVRNVKDSTIGYFLAKAAVQEALFEMSRLSQPGAALEAGIVFKQQRVAHQPLTFNLDTGTAQCLIENEAGKLDLNTGSPLVLRNLLMGQFELNDNPADAIVSQWTEWRKQKIDSKGVVHGGPLTAVEDLLALPGMKPEFVYGDWRRSREGQVEHRRGLLELATVYSDSPRINLNYAPLEILRSIPGVDAAEATAIANARTQRYFESIDDCQQRVPIQFNDDAKNLVTVEESSFFTLIATGRASDSSYERTVRAMIKLRSNDPLGFRVLYWKDEEI